MTPLLYQSVTRKTEAAVLNELLAYHGKELLSGRVSMDYEFEEVLMLVQETGDTLRCQNCSCGKTAVQKLTRTIMGLSKVRVLEILLDVRVGHMTSVGGRLFADVLTTCCPPPGHLTLCAI